MFRPKKYCKTRNFHMQKIFVNSVNFYRFLLYSLSGSQKIIRISTTTSWLHNGCHLTCFKLKGVCFMLYSHHLFIWKGLGGLSIKERIKLDISRFDEKILTKKSREHLQTWDYFLALVHPNKIPFRILSWHNVQLDEKISILRYLLVGYDYGQNEMLSHMVYGYKDSIRNS